MRRWRYVALFSWLILGSLLLGRHWAGHPSAWNPVPDWFWKALAARLTFGCCEGAADVEFYVLWGAAFILIALFTTVVWIAAACLRRRMYQ